MLKEWIVLYGVIRLSGQGFIKPFRLFGENWTWSMEVKEMNFENKGATNIISVPYWVEHIC